MMAFHPGQKVECVAKPRYSPWEHISMWIEGTGDRAVIGAVYTVSNVYVAHDGEEMIELHELPQPETRSWYAGYLAHCFRPLTEQKTDISVFVRMLTPKTETVG
jgi:hypothetical protein